MAFDQSTITSGPVSVQDGLDLLISWTCSDAAPTFQVYLDRRLAWYGTKSRARIKVSPDGSVHEVAVGTCLASEARTDLSASLPAPLGGTGNRALLSWLGGTFLDDRIVGFHVYQGAAPGVAPVTTGSPTAVVTAYPQEVILDGFGMGGFGEGGFGRAASNYSWTSAPLASGAWSFVVEGFDDAGNPGTPTTLGVTIISPPSPPVANADGTRISVSYNSTTHEATLTWTPA